MLIITVVIGLLVGVFVVRTIGLAVFETRTSVADSKPRPAKFRMAFAIAISLGCVIAVIGILANNGPIRILGIGITFVSVPILVARFASARAEFRKKGTPD
jgi:hypothetical protein